MRRSTGILLFTLLVSLFVSAQDDMSEPPSVLPPSCSIFTFSSIANSPGSESFRLLQFEIQALKTAGEAYTSMVNGGKEAKGETPVSAAASLLSSAAAGRNGFACSAFISGQMPQPDDPWLVVRSSSIFAYNVMTNVAEGLRLHTKRRLASFGDPSLDVDDAENLAEMTEARNAAIAMLMDAVTTSLMTSRKVGANSGLVDTWKFSDSERLQLLKQLAFSRGVSDSSNDYTKIARFIESAIRKRTKCS